MMMMMMTQENLEILYEKKISHGRRYKLLSFPTLTYVLPSTSAKVGMINHNGMKLNKINSRLRIIFETKQE